jgi:hypothetical protein
MTSQAPTMVDAISRPFLKSRFPSFEDIIFTESFSQDQRMSTHIVPHATALRRHPPRRRMPNVGPDLSPETATRACSIATATFAFAEMLLLPHFIGSFAFCRSGDPTTGRYQPIQVLRRFGGLES